MGHLNMSDLGYGSEFLKLSPGGASLVRRPTRSAPGRSLSGLIDPQGLYGLYGLGGLGLEEASPCGPAPELQPGEQAQCCPNLGWVVYASGSESVYGLCERAAAATGTSSTAALPTDPLARVAALRAQLDARRAATDEQRFEQQKQELQLRFVASQMQAVQAAEAARQQSIAAAESARLRAAAEERQAKIQSEKTKQFLIVGGIGVVIAKVAGLF